ncbi:hypothetical protein ACHAWF_005239 [Thalassiosira exigua]
MSLFSRLSILPRAAPAEEAVGPPAAANDGGPSVPGAPPAPAATASAGASRKSSIDIAAASGVLLKTLKPGDITNYPKEGDSCAIHYEAFTEEELYGPNAKDPEPFDSSRSREEEFRFRLGAGQVIEGMDLAVARMSVGQVVEATIPYPFAYGVAGYPPVVPPRATLIFRIELIRISSSL